MRIVAECVIDHIDERLRALKNAETLASSRQTSELRKILACLALTYRELTSFVQRILFRRVIINSDELVHFFEEPIRGDHIEQVFFEYDLRDTALSSDAQLMTMLELINRHLR